jgi:beta-N-acetylhexosaminidase
VKGGVACAVGHFPGLGAAAQSTDAGPASVGLDPATLASRDLPPFVAAFEAGAPATVVSHGLYTAYDPVTPASLSPEIVSGLLRDELGYEGAAISDDIGAGAISAVTDPGSAAVEALNAGIDLVQVADPADVGDVREALAAALASGELDEARLEEAAARVSRIGVRPPGGSEKKGARKKDGD